MMQLTFKSFLQLDNIYLPESYDWAKSIAALLPNINITLPEITKKAKIYDIQYNKNPILIQLDDGSKLFMTIEQFRRIEGKPAIGKTMVVSMQRLSNDATDSPSKITNCKII